MALTTEQEAKVLQIITAFQNGKRVNELPAIETGNPFDLTVEVLDTDGESKQAKLAGLYPYIEELCAYGIEWDMTVSTSKCIRIGNLAFHRNLPVQIKMRGCLLDDNGNVVEYLQPGNWKSHDRSGAKGQVMVEIPAHYRRFETDGTKRRAKISELPLPGYHLVPKYYMSAYEASLERSTGKLCSVVNLATDYRGGVGDKQEWDGTYRSLLGRPVTGMTRAQLRTAARKRGAGTQWNINDYNVYKAVVWLCFIEYADFNSQALFDASPDINGYRQGGLGGGFIPPTNAEWNTLNGYNPFFPCGHTDGFGNASGETAYQVNINGDGSNIKAVYANRYRGIENIFGHLRKITDGINIIGNTSTVYVCDDPSKYVDNACTGYEMRGAASRTTGYAKEIIFGEFGEIIPSTVGGSSSNWFCDYFNSVTNITDLRCVHIGGCAYDMSVLKHAGILLVLPQSAATSVGPTRLCFIPA